VTTEQTDAIWLTDPAAYLQRMRDLVGEGDPLEVLAEGPETYGRIVAQQTAARMQARPFPGKWTPNEIIGHLADVELVYGFRMRMILCHDQPEISGYDQDLWVAGQRHNEREPAELLEMFRTYRAFNLTLWRQIGPQELERVGVHAERGPESLATMRVSLAGHDLWHLDQITRYLDAADGS
jgi:hypothetical protein